MTDRDALRIELITALTPYIDPDSMEDAKMKITMALQQYEVKKDEAEIIVYEGDVNTNMLQRFLMAKIARGCSRRTVKYYKQSISMAFDKIGKPYNQITADDIRYYLAMRVGKDGVSKTTANNERRNLSSFYGWLQQEEILLTNPMQKVERIKTEKKERKAFSQMEIELLRSACQSSMELAIIETMISTWARVSEIAQIKRSEIENNRVTVHGKGNKDRTVYLTPKAQLAVERFLGERSDNNPYLFPRAKNAGDVEKMMKGHTQKEAKEWYRDPENVSADGHRDVSTIESSCRSLGRRAGVAGVHPHRFRRTGATMALRSGMPLMSVSKILGHANIGTTQIYLDISEKELEQAHEKWVI